MLADVVLHDQQVVAHIFLVHIVNSFFGVFRLFEVHITVVQTFRLGGVLLHDCGHDFAEGSEHFTKLIVARAFREIFNEDVRVHVSHVRHSTLSFTFVKHHLQRLVMEQFAIQVVDSSLS